MSDKPSILVAVDFGETSSRAFELAIDLASRATAQLVIVHAAAPPPAEMINRPDEVPAIVDAKKQLILLEQRAAAAGVQAEGYLKLETPIFALLEAIKEQQPLFVVVGSHGRRGVSRALLGSVSDELSRRSPVPVMIVPAPERQATAEKLAYSCADCGHILGPQENGLLCLHCNTTPARWVSAPIVSGPVDAGVASVGESVGYDLEDTQTGSSGGLFATCAPGQEGISPNPELRVRY